MATATAKQPKTYRIAQQILDLEDRREALHAEMTSGLTGRVDSQWFGDRANEMEHLNRSLTRLRVLHESLVA
jgi:hypothetical protein